MGQLIEVSFHQLSRDAAIETLVRRVATRTAAGGGTIRVRIGRLQFHAAVRLYVSVTLWQEGRRAQATLHLPKASREVALAETLSRALALAERRLEREPDGEGTLS